MCFFQSSLIKSKLNSEQFELSYWLSQKNCKYLSGGRGQSLKINIEGNTYVLKKYLRGGLLAKLLYNRYFWFGCTKSRPHLEKNILMYAKKLGLPVPNFAAYYVQKTGLFYRATIITKYINNLGTLASYLESKELSDEQWLDLAALINRFHQAQINHVDLNADNILLHMNKGALTFSVIDFDKARIENHYDKWPLENIMRLQRSLFKIQPVYFNNKAQKSFSNAFNI